MDTKSASALSRRYCLFLGLLPTHVAFRMFFSDTGVHRETTIEWAFCALWTVMLQRTLFLGLVRQHHFAGNFTSRN